MRKKEVSLVGALVICAIAIIARQLFKLHLEKSRSKRLLMLTG